MAENALVLVMSVEHTQSSVCGGRTIIRCAALRSLSLSLSLSLSGLLYAERRRYLGPRARAGKCDGNLVNQTGAGGGHGIVPMRMRWIYV